MVKERERGYTPPSLVFLPDQDDETGINQVGGGGDFRIIAPVLEFLPAAESRIVPLVFKLELTPVPNGTIWQPGPGPR